jgi:hypothetical protein
VSSTGSSSSSESNETDDAIIVRAVGAYVGVIEAAQEFVTVQTEWREELEKTRMITPVTARRRADAIDGLMAAVAALEGEEPSGVHYGPGQPMNVADLYRILAGPALDGSAVMGGTNDESEL